jgi:choline dehydrogenase-like flavoprotein
MSQGRIYTGDDLTADTIVDCDVCVIGSGPGGAVLANELVGRGLHVVMLEEGGHWTKRDFDLTEATAYPHLYQDHGNRATDDLSILILQGRSVGGGTTVNWCTSFRAPPRTLARWQETYGLVGLTEESLRPHYEALEKRIHIAEWPLERMNANNRKLWDGCGKLGYDRALIRRNVHNCANLGYCGLGCPLDAKQSMLVTLLPDAVEKGLTLYANAWAKRLVTDRHRVTAVEALIADPATDRAKGVTLTVRPKVTAVCGGAINSPALLLRSGLTGGGRVGLRTFLHPVVVMTGEYDEPVEPWSGAPQSASSHHFADRGEGKLGFFLEAAPAHPMLAAVNTTGIGMEHRAAMGRLRFTGDLIALAIDGFLDQDDEGGAVSLRRGAEGRPHITYPLKAPHFEAFRAACKEMARIQFAAGAKLVRSFQAKPLELRSPAEIDRLDQATWEKLLVRVVTAHQMGGCAMGADPARSVVDPQLRYRGMDNLFVVDGSVFPTGLGVNPQETVMALSRWAAPNVAA